MVPANEADPDRRAEIERGLLTATEERGGNSYREQIERQRASRPSSDGRATRTCASTARASIWGRCPSRPAGSSAASETSYPRMLEPELRRTLGIGFGGLDAPSCPASSGRPGLTGISPAQG